MECALHRRIGSYRLLDIHDLTCTVAGIRSLRGRSPLESVLICDVDEIAGYLNEISVSERKQCLSNRFVGRYHVHVGAVLNDLLARYGVLLDPPPVEPP